MTGGWTVWVGGIEVNDRLLGFTEAEALAETYRAEDYDDVHVAFVNVYTVRNDGPLVYDPFGPVPFPRSTH